jgi:hypothetical protein
LSSAACTDRDKVEVRPAAAARLVPVFRKPLRLAEMVVPALLWPWEDVMFVSSGERNVLRMKFEVNR